MTEHKFGIREAKDYGFERGGASEVIESTVAIKTVKKVNMESLARWVIKYAEKHGEGDVEVVFNKSVFGFYVRDSVGNTWELF